MSSSNQAFDIQAYFLTIQELDDESLRLHMFQVEHSLSKLLETNKELHEEIEATRQKQNTSTNANEGYSSDINLYKETIEENLSAKQAKEERLSIVRNELQKRGLLAGTVHNNDHEGFYL